MRWPRRQATFSVDIDQLSAGVAEAANSAVRALVDRQDAAAEQANDVARALLAANERVAGTAQEMISKLDVIHTLVNSNMTAALQSELDATVRELAMMREVVALKQATGREPSKDALAAIQATEGKIRELQAGLADRLKQSDIVEAQVLAGAERDRTDREP